MTIEFEFYYPAMCPAFVAVWVFDGNNKVVSEHIHHVKNMSRFTDMFSRSHIPSDIVYNGNTVCIRFTFKR